MTTANDEQAGTVLKVNQLSDGKWRLIAHGDGDEGATVTQPLGTRVHTRLRKLGLEIPTEAEEESNRVWAFTLYEAAGDELRRAARGTLNDFRSSSKASLSTAFAETCSV